MAPRRAAEGVNSAATEPGHFRESRRHRALTERTHLPRGVLGQGKSLGGLARGNRVLS